MLWLFLLIMFSHGRWPQGTTGGRCPGPDRVVSERPHQRIADSIRV